MIRPISHIASRGVVRTSYHAVQQLCSFSSDGGSPQRRFSPHRQTRSTSNTERLRIHAVPIHLGDYSIDDDDISPYDDEAKISDEEKMRDKTKLAEEIYESTLEEETKRAVNLAKSKKPIRVPVIDQHGRAYGRGGRKTATAQVWITPGFGEVTVNQKPFDETFIREFHRDHILQPFVATETCGKFDVVAQVRGGGLSGQAGAVRHGIARALNHFNPDLYRPPLKKQKLLTRDRRKVERKKVGLVKSRKAPQWVKR